MGSALAFSPTEYQYGTAQTSNLAITNHANSIDAAFNDSAASVGGPFGDGPSNHWTFTALQDTSLTAIAGVVADIRFSQSGWANDSSALEVYDGITWNRVATYNGANPPPGSLTTLTYDVTPLLNTVAKVNAAQIRLIGVGMAGARDSITISVDGVRRGIEMPPAPTATPTATASPTATPRANRHSHPQWHAHCPTNRHRHGYCHAHGD